MRNKLKIAAVVLVVVAGMVLYKQHSDKQEAKKDAKVKASKSN